MSDHILGEPFAVPWSVVVRFAKRLIADGADPLDRMRILRETYDLSLLDAKRADFAARGIDLDKAQGRLAHALDELPDSEDEPSG